MGVRSRINSVVLVRLSSISKVTSPLYDLGANEEDMRRRWKKHFGLS